MTKSCNVTEHIQFCRQGTTRTNCPAVNSSVVHPTKVRLRRRFIRWEAVIVLLLLPHDFALSKLLLGCLHGNDAMVHTATSQSHSFLQGQVSTSISVFLPDWNSRKITTCHPKKLRNLKMDFSLQKVFASFFWQVPAVFFFSGMIFVCIPFLKIFKSPSSKISFPPLPHFRVDDEMFFSFFSRKVNDPTHLLAMVSSFSFGDGWRRWCNISARLIEKRTQLQSKLLHEHTKLPMKMANRMMRNFLVASQLLYPRKSFLFLLRKGQVWAALKQHYSEGKAHGQREVNSPLLSQIRTFRHVI